MAKTYILRYKGNTTELHFNIHDYIQSQCQGSTVTQGLHNLKYPMLNTSAVAVFGIFNSFCKRGPAV